jgi:hypothetical protein
MDAHIRQALAANFFPSDAAANRTFSGTVAGLTDEGVRPTGPASGVTISPGRHKLRKSGFTPRTRNPQCEARS